MPKHTLNKALLADTLRCAPRGDLYVFAYGSLMWNPGFRYRQFVAARLFGYARRCAVYSTYYRGSEQQPGLVLGLDRGGSCHGVLYRVARAQKAAVMEYLFQREMFADVYYPRYVTAIAADRHHRALTFIVRRDSRQYAAPMPPEQAAAIIHRACGVGGKNPEYFYNTYQQLQQLGAPSPMLAQLCRLLTACAQRSANSP